MDASDILRKKQARVLAYIQQNPTATTSKGQVPNNPPLTPSQISEIKSQYPASDFANTNGLFPCPPKDVSGAGPFDGIICSTIYTTKYYYNSTN
jgi:hypothetical protein